MTLPTHKTKIVCTIGPASNSPEVMEQMLLAGMNVARINFSHGDFASHGRVIADLRQAARTVGSRLAIMADLPGPKIRIGDLAAEPVELTAGGALHPDHRPRFWEIFPAGLRDLRSPGSSSRATNFI